MYDNQLMESRDDNLKQLTFSVGKNLNYLIPLWFSNSYYLHEGKASILSIIRGLVYRYRLISKNKKKIH